jgi:hypothetical protein
MPYRFVEFRRELDGFDDWTVVWVDLDKLLDLHKGDIGYTLSPVSSWSHQKIEGIQELLKPPYLCQVPNSQAPWMPRVAIHARSKYPRKRTWKEAWFGLRPTLEALGMTRPSKFYVDQPYISFINGRHRAYYLLAVGATQIPVEIQVSQAGLLQKHCTGG